VPPARPTTKQRDLSWPLWSSPAWQGPSSLSNYTMLPRGVKRTRENSAGRRRLGAGLGRIGRTKRAAGRPRGGRRTGPGVPSGQTRRVCPLLREGGPPYRRGDPVSSTQAG